jgi:hypothetical protein
MRQNELSFGRLKNFSGPAGLFGALAREPMLPIRLARPLLNKQAPNQQLDRA